MKTTSLPLIFNGTIAAAINNQPIQTSTPRGAGGDRQTQLKLYLESSELPYEYQDLTMPLTEAGMVKRKYELEETIDTKANKPIDVLNPSTATETDIILHAKYRQRLSESTYKKHLRSIHAVMNSKVPYNPYKPDFKEFLRHMDYREEFEEATREALRHERDAVNMFNRAFGIPEFIFKLPAQKRNKKVVLPLPEIVREFWRYDYPISDYKRRLFQYIYFFGFYVGVRAPSELAILKTSNIVFNPNGTATLTVVEMKKNYSERTVVLPREIATDPLHKSLKNWMTKWRPECKNDYLFVQENGKPFEVRHLGHELSQNGKLVWPQFHPYIMRHWSATARLIEQKMKTNTFDLRPVTEWLGHEKQSTTETYIRSATMYYDIAQYSWLSRILKHPQPKRMGDNAVELENDEKSTNGRKTSLSSGT